MFKQNEDKHYHLPVCLFGLGDISSNSYTHKTRAKQDEISLEDRTGRSDKRTQKMGVKMGPVPIEDVVG